MFLSSQQPLSKLSCNNPHSPPPPHHFHRWSTTGSLTGYLVYLKILRSHSTEWQKSLAFKVKSIRIFFLQKKQTNENKNENKAKQKRSRRKHTKNEQTKKSDEKKKTKKENCEIFEVLRNESYQKLAESSAFNLYRKRFLLLIF